MSSAIAANFLRGVKARPGKWSIRLEGLAYVSTLAAGVLALSGLGELLLSSQRLRELLPAGVATDPLAASGILMLAISLLLLLPRSADRSRKLAGRIISGLVCAIGALLLAMQITGVDRTAGELFQVGTPAAAALLAGGAAALILDRGGGGSIVPSDLLGLLVLIAGAFPFVAFVYGASELYGPVGWTDTSFTASLAIALLGLAILLARPSRGLLKIVTEPGTAGTIVRRLLLPILLFPLLVGWVQVRVLSVNEIEYQFVAVLGTVLLVSVLLSLLVGFGRRLSLAEQERERAAQEVREAQERFSVAIVAARAGALDWDLTTDRIVWSRESYLLYGLGPRGLPDNYGDWLALVHPEDRQTISRSVQRAIESGGDVEMQFRVVGEDGETRWFESTGRVLRDLDGRPVRFTGITRDITSEKLNEIRLRRTAQRLELLYNTTISVLMTEDAQEAARAVCERVLSHLDCQVMLNYVTSESRADHIELYSWAGISDEQAKTWSVMHVDEIISGTVVRDGTRLVIEDVPSQPQDPRMNVIRDLGMLAYACHPLMADSQVVGTIGFGSRTVRRFSLETLALMQAVANHVSLVIQRSRAIQELANARAWRERFLSLVAEELRTPLSAILLSAEMLQQARDYEKQRECAETISRNGAMEARLIDGLLDASRVICGPIELNRQPLSLHGVVRAAVEAGWHEARDRQLIVTTELKSENDSCAGDIQRLQQAFWNILRHAIRHTPARGTITVSSSTAENGRIRVRIRSSGAELWHNELERCMTLAMLSGIKPAEDSLQLSMLIAREIIRLHEGLIQVSGAGLEITFPLASGMDVRSGQATGQDAASPVRVLLADGNGDSRRALAMTLSAMAHEVEMADSISAALDHLRMGSFDILIADAMLPDGTGAALLDQARGIQPVGAILVGGDPADEQIRRCIRVGSGIQLGKPVTSEKLRTAIARLMSHSPAASAAQQVRSL